jgi:hypothetical protein
MKTILVFLSLYCALNIGFSQVVKESSVPAAVKTTFAQLYPNSKAEKWEWKNALYEVRFKKDNSTQYMTLESSGEWVNTKTELKASELPEAVSASLSKNYPAQNSREMFKVINAAGGSVTYQVNLTGLSLYFRPDGSLLKTEKEAGKSDHEF